MTNGKAIRYFFNEKDIDEIVINLSETGMCPSGKGAIGECALDCEKCWKEFLNRDDGILLDVEIPEK